MRGFKYGYLAAMTGVYTIALCICAVTDIWEHYWWLCMLVCAGGMMAGGAGYQFLLMQQMKRSLKKAEEERLWLQQKRYRLVLDNSEDMMYEIGIQEPSELGSDRIYEKFGWHIPRQCSGLDADMLQRLLHVCAEDEPQIRLLYDRITKQGRSGRIVVRIQKQQGDYLWCAVTGFPLYDSAQHLISIVGRIEDVDHETKLRKKLEKENRTDCMTGLINKSTFANETIRYLRQNPATNTAVIFIDMDHFKEINDTMGHSMGDNVICDMAQKLQVIFANCDLVARFGGDEFCIFVKDIPSETLKSKLEWTVAKLRSTYTNGTEYVATTASIGAAYCRCEAADYQQLLDMADSALYEAKAKGRNQYVVKDIVNHIPSLSKFQQAYIN